MSEVTGVRITLPDLVARDFTYDFLPVYERKWFSVNLSFDVKELRATLGFRIQSPLHFHIGAAKEWGLIFDFKTYDILLGFEIRF